MSFSEEQLAQLSQLVAASVSQALAGQKPEATASTTPDFSAQERTASMAGDIKSSMKREAVNKLVNNVAIKQEMRTVAAEVLNSRLQVIGEYPNYQVVGMIDGAMASAEKAFSRWVETDPTLMPFLSETRTVEKVDANGVVRREVSRIANPFEVGTVNLSKGAQYVSEARASGDYARVDALLKQANQGRGLAPAFRDLMRKRDSGQAI